MSVLLLGFPEHMLFGEFCRRYHALLPGDGGDDSSMNKKEAIELVLQCQGVDKNSYRIGLSQTFFRAGTLAALDRMMEESSHDVMVRFQVS